MADLEQQVRERLAEMQPYLERSGGSVEFVGLEDRVAKIRFALTRPGTSRLVVSLQMVGGIERTLTNAIPELRGVEAVNLPPYVLEGWDQPEIGPVITPVREVTSGPTSGVAR